MFILLTAPIKIIFRILVLSKEIFLSVLFYHTFCNAPKYIYIHKFIFVVFLEFFSSSCFPGEKIEMSEITMKIKGRFMSKLF